MKVPIEVPPGIVVDDTTFSVGQTAWADCNNIRFWRGQPQVIGGWQRLVTTAATGVCRSIFPWTDNGAQLNIGFGTNTNLELWIGGSLYDITPSSGFTPGNVDGTGGSGYGTGTYGTGTYGQPGGGTFFPLTWSLAAYGQTLMACPRGQTIFQWNNVTGTPAVAVTNAPAAVTYMLVAKTRQVMAFGCNEETSGTFNPRCIRGSDIEDPTDWTSTVTNNAFEFILEGSGRIVAARLIGDYIFVWTDNELYLGSFDPTLNAAGLPNGWNFPSVGQSCGLIGPNAAVVLSDQAAYWFGSNGQVHACLLGGAPQIVVCPLQEDVFSHIAASQQEKIVASSCTEFGEIRFDYPDSRDGIENSRYFVYSSGGNLSGGESWQRLDTVWSKGIMVRTAYVDAGPSPYPLAVDYTGDIYYHELGLSADGATFDAYAETADFYAGDVEQVLEITGIWPDVQAQTGTVNFTIYTRLYPQDANVRSRGPFALMPGQSKKDFLISGRIARLRYESTSAPMFWRLGKPVYDAIPAGMR